MVPVFRKFLKFITLHQLAMGKDATALGHYKLSKSPKSPLKTKLRRKPKTVGDNPKSLLQIQKYSFFTSANGDLYIEWNKYYSGNLDARRIIDDTLRRNKMIYVTQNGKTVGTSSTLPPIYVNNAVGKFYIDENKFNEIIAVPGFDDSGVKKAMVEVLRAKSWDLKVYVTGAHPSYPNGVVKKEIYDKSELNLGSPPVIDPAPLPVRFNTHGFVFDLDENGNIHILNSVFTQRVGHQKDRNYIDQVKNRQSDYRKRDGSLPVVLLVAHNYGTVEKYNWRIREGRFTGYDVSSEFKDFEHVFTTPEEVERYANYLLRQNRHGFYIK